MKQVPLLLTLLISVSIFTFLSGCGDSSGTVTGSAFSTAATCTIKWPPLTRLIPSLSQSITITLSGVGGYTATQTVDRPAEGETSTVTFTHVPVGDVTVTATAFPENGGQGVAMATGTVTQAAQVDAPLQMTLTMNTTITWLYATPGNAMVSVGRTFQMGTGAMNTHTGEHVLINTNRLKWTSSTPWIATIDEHTGLVTGVTAGTAIMRIEDTETGLGSDFEVLIRELDTSLYWGTSGSGPGQLYLPKGITTDATGNVYVADSSNHRIQKYSSQGALLRSFGSFGAGQDQFSTPSDLVVDTAGNIYVGDEGNRRIKKYTSDFIFLTSWGSNGTGPGQFNGMAGLAIYQNQLFVVDRELARISVFSLEGQFVRSWGEKGSGPGQMNYPYGLTIMPNGQVYVCDASVTDPGHGGIVIFDEDGTYLDRFGEYGSFAGQMAFPHGIAHDVSGNLYVASSGRLQKYTADGQFLRLVSSYGTAEGYVKYPIDTAIDASGVIYVVDFDNCRVQAYQ
ncbi:MAG: NHL repeat-containing protein [Armatimonadota bacterium]